MLPNESFAEWYMRTSICDPYLSGIDEFSIREVRRRQAEYDAKFGNRAQQAR